MHTIFRSAYTAHTTNACTHNQGAEGESSERLLLLLPHFVLVSDVVVCVRVCVAVERRKRNPAPPTTAYTSLVRLNSTAALLTYDMLSSPRVQWSMEVALEHTTTAAAPVATEMES